MQSNGQATTHPLPEKGLPPVAPPSASFLAKLFGIPLLLVLGLVGIGIGVIWLRDLSLTPESFLRKLDSGNPEERWRGAEDLAQVLLRDEKLAANPAFALDLAERLRAAMQAARVGGPNTPDAGADAKSLEPEQKYVYFLSACVGNVIIPVGVPLLNEMAVKEGGGDAKAVHLRRYLAVWALAKAGESLKRFDKLDQAKKEAIIAELDTEAAGTTERATLATAARDSLRHRVAGQPRTMGVDVALSQCAGDRHPVLREITAFALNSWEGDASENTRIEETLAKLTMDDGRGQELRVLPEDSKNDTQEISTIPGLATRYNATIAVARRGSSKTRLDILEEMLDEEQQLNNFRLKPAKGDEVANETLARGVVLNALKALPIYHQRVPARDLSQFDPALAKLAKSSNAVIRNQAEAAKSALNASKP